MRKLFDNVKVLASLVPATRTADANGTAIDTQGYGDGVVVIAAGDIDLADTNETYVVNIEESDASGSGFTAVSGLSVTITADNQIALLRLSELNVARKRYLRAVLDVGGTTPSIPGTALFLLGEAYAAPVNND